MGLDHGKHNKAVCDKLNVLDDFKCNDWIVTTAFYASIHYLDHKLFVYDSPDGTKINNINEAHKKLKVAQSKHETRGVLVNRKIKELYEDYHFLQQECFNARYVNYDIHPNIASLAIRRRDKIIAHCEK